MRIRLDLVHRHDSGDNDHDYERCDDDDTVDDDDDDDDGPKQLIRPMPDRLRAYVTTNDYKDFCRQRIDPLLEELYETEESTRRRQTCLHNLIFFMLFVYACLAVFSGYYAIFLVMWSTSTVLILTSILARQNFSGREIEEEIRTECETMSERCNSSSNSATGSSTHYIFFDLVMKRIWMSSDENGHHYTRKLSHINVTILDKERYGYDNDDRDDNFKHPSWC